MSRVVVAKAAVGAAASALLLTGVGVGAAEASQEGACKTVVQVTVAAAQMARSQAADLREYRAAKKDNKAKAAAMKKKIQKMPLPPKLQKYRKLMLRTSAAYFAGMAGWYAEDMAAKDQTAYEGFHYVSLGNQRECTSVTEYRNANKWIGDATNTVNQNLATFEADAKANIPTFEKGIWNAWKKFNNGRLTLKNIRIFVRTVANLTKTLLANTVRIPADFERGDRAATDLLTGPTQLGSLGPSS